MFEYNSLVFKLSTLIAFAIVVIPLIFVDSKPVRSFIALERRLPSLGRILLNLGPPNLVFIPAAILVEPNRWLPFLLTIYCGVALLALAFIAIDVLVGRVTGTWPKTIRYSLKNSDWYRPTGAMHWLYTVFLVAMIALQGTPKEGPIPYSQSSAPIATHWHALSTTGPMECAR